MRRIPYIVLTLGLVLAVLLAGCAPQTTGAPTTAPGAAATETPAEAAAPTETTAAVAPTETTAAATAEATEGAAAEPTVTLEPTATPEVQPGEVVTETAGGVALKVGMVTDVGGIDDKSFNATSWEGVLMAIDQLGVEGTYLESQQPTDYERNIAEFLQQNYNMIITVGYLLGDATLAAAQNNPDVSFAIVDYQYDSPPDNLLGLFFATDQAAYLAGYLAAGMSQTGTVATFGGLDIPTVTIFMDAYAQGVTDYNAAHGTNVQVLGQDFFVGNFESTDDGRRAAESLMDEGADILMPVAGPVGLGAAAVVKERGGMLIGVDTDWFISAPEYSDIVLTSVMKNMDVAVYNAIADKVNGNFQGGTYLGTLENDGVGLAPFHNFADQVPADLTTEINDLTGQIIAGQVNTGFGG